MAYSFQVAAQNVYGVGAFSDPVNTLYGSQGIHIINIEARYCIIFFITLAYNNIVTVFVY